MSKGSQSSRVVWQESGEWGKTHLTSDLNKLLGQQGPYEKIKQFARKMWKEICYDSVKKFRRTEKKCTLPLLWTDREPTDRNDWCSQHKEQPGHDIMYMPAAYCECKSSFVFEREFRLYHTYTFTTLMPAQVKKLKRKEEQGPSPADWAMVSKHRCFLGLDLQE